MSGCLDTENNLHELKIVGKWKYTLTREAVHGETNLGGGNMSFLTFTIDSKMIFYNSDHVFIGQENFRMNESEFIVYGVNEFTGEKWESDADTYYFKQDTLVFRSNMAIEKYYVRLK